VKIYIESFFVRSNEMTSVQDSAAYCAAEREERLPPRSSGPNGVDPTFYRYRSATRERSERESERRDMERAVRMDPETWANWEARRIAALLDEELVASLKPEDRKRVEEAQKNPVNIVTLEWFARLPLPTRFQVMKRVRAEMEPHEERSKRMERLRADMMPPKERADILETVQAGERVAVQASVEKVLGREPAGGEEY